MADLKRMALSLVFFFYFSQENKCKSTTESGVRAARSAHPGTPCELVWELGEVMVMVLK